MKITRWLGGGLQQPLLSCMGTRLHCAERSIVGSGRRRTPCSYMADPLGPLPLSPLPLSPLPLSPSHFGIAGDGRGPTAYAFPCRYQAAARLRPNDGNLWNNLAGAYTAANLVRVPP
jgi:hypothetical protein